MVIVFINALKVVNLDENFETGYFWNKGSWTERVHLPRGLTIIAPSKMDQLIDDYAKDGGSEVV